MGDKTSDKMIKCLRGVATSNRPFTDTNIEDEIEDILDTNRVKPKQVTNVESNFYSEDNNSDSMISQGDTYYFSYKIWYKG